MAYLTADPSAGADFDLTAPRLRQPEGGSDPTASEFLDVLFLDAADVPRAHAAARRGGAPEWRRRVLAWRLEGNSPPRRGRGRPPDYETALKVAIMGMAGYTWATVAEKLDTQAEGVEIQDLQRKTLRAIKARRKMILANREYMVAGYLAAFPE